MYYFKQIASEIEKHRFIFFFHFCILASPNPHADKNFINVEFDDGDSGRIPLDHIRMIPEDFPIVCKYLQCYLATSFTFISNLSSMSIVIIGLVDRN